MDDFLDDEQQGGSPFNPMDILRLFLRRKWLFVVPFVLCQVLAVALVFEFPQIVLWLPSVMFGASATPVAN